MTQRRSCGNCRFFARIPQGECHHELKVMQALDGQGRLYTLSAWAPTREDALGCHHHEFAEDAGEPAPAPLNGTKVLIR